MNLNIPALSLLMFSLSAYAESGRSMLAGYVDSTIDASGYNHKCLLSKGQVRCWGAGEQGLSIVPALKNPSQISTGLGHVCALHDEGVKCWGSNSHGQTSVPPLEHPTHVSAGEHHTCALHARGVACWGNEGDTLERSSIPPLKNPVQISAGGYHTCALHDDGVSCWGWDQYGDTKVPTLKNPTQVTAGMYHSCALDDNGVHCWGGPNFHNSPELPPVVTQVPPLQNPTYISAGHYHTCAIHDAGVACWGETRHSSSQIIPPSELVGPGQVTFKIELKRLPAFLTRLSQDLTRISSTFARTLSLALTRLEAEALLKSQSEIDGLRLFTFNALDPLISSLNSQAAETDLKPEFIKQLKQANQAFGIRKLHDVPLKPATMLMALEFIRASAHGMSRYASTQEDQSTLQSLISRSGEAIALSNGDPTHTSLQELFRQIDRSGPLLGRMSTTYPNRGLATSLRVASEFLRR